MSAASAPEDPELKGGHAPAVKAGGKRIVQHKQQVAGEKPAEQLTPEEEEEYGASPPKADKHHQSILLAGVVTKGDKDFTEEAVKSYHQKPQPTVEKKRAAKPQFNIHQPSKQ